MGRVVHFEIHAADPDRVMAFYRGLFGWQFSAYGPPGEFWLVTTGADDRPGINGGIVKRRGANPDPAAPTPVVGYVCTVEVADIDAAMKSALAGGGTLALEKAPIPGLAWIAYMKDTESNIFGIYQADPNAK